MSPDAVAAVACSVWLDFANWVYLAFRLSKSPILGCAAKASNQSVTCACGAMHIDIQSMGMGISVFAGHTEAKTYLMPPNKPTSVQQSRSVCKRCSARHQGNEAFAGTCVVDVIC